MAYAPRTSKGLRFFRGTGTDLATTPWQIINGISDWAAPTPTIQSIDMTTIKDEATVYAPGIRESGSSSMTLYFDDLNTIHQNLLIADSKSAVNIPYRIDFTETGTSVAFMGHPTSVPVSGSVGSANSAAITFYVSGDPVWTFGSGSIPELDPSQFPESVKERFVIVTNEAAMLSLTITDVQNGDSVIVKEPKPLMYAVIDDGALGTMAAFYAYQSKSDWSLLSSVPAAFKPSAHADESATYGLATTTLYGHAKITTTTPKALGVANVGSEDAFARGDHVHPAQTNVSGNAATATQWKTPRTFYISGVYKAEAIVNGTQNIDFALERNIQSLSSGAGNVSVELIPSVTHIVTVDRDFTVTLPAGLQSDKFYEFHAILKAANASAALTISEPIQWENNTPPSLTENKVTEIKIQIYGNIKIGTYRIFG